MKILLIPILSLLSISLFAQTYKELGSDPQGDHFGNYGVDLKSIHLAVDKQQDSIWIKLEAYTEFTGDYGFAILFDTNKNTTDGVPWNVTNNGGNNDLNYEWKLDVMNNTFFPPTHVILYDTSGKVFTQDIQLSSPNKNTVIVRLALSEIDADGDFNLLVGGGQFDGIINDNMPNSAHFEFNSNTNTSILETTANDRSLIYPNPFSSLIQLNSTEASTIQIYNLEGQLMRKETIQSRESLDLSELKIGIYIVNISSDSETSTQRIIKQ